MTVPKSPPVPTRKWSDRPEVPPEVFALPIGTGYQGQSALPDVKDSKLPVATPELNRSGQTHRDYPTRFLMGSIRRLADDSMQAVARPAEFFGQGMVGDLIIRQVGHRSLWVMRGENRKLRWPINRQRIEAKDGLLELSSKDGVHVLQIRQGDRSRPVEPRLSTNYLSAISWNSWMAQGWPLVGSFKVIRRNLVTLASLK